MKATFKKYLFLVFFGAGFTFSDAMAQEDPLVIILHSYKYNRGDSIQMEAWLTNYSKKTNALTLQLWIDNTETGKRWKFRYPLINGQVQFALKVGETIPDGKYAFNFLLQKDFFHAEAKLSNESGREKSLNYIMICKDKQTIVDNVILDKEGNFRIGHLLFKDTAFFIFSPAKRNRANDLFINLQTPLDSAFVPAAAETDIITIGDPQSVSGKNADTSVHYVFNVNDKPKGIVMQEVVVKSKAKKLIDQFEKENVSGLFSGGDAKVFDGLENDELGDSPDLFLFLESRVPGLRSGTDSETGMPVLMWRNQQTDVYINEIKATDFSPYDINTRDIAMIKVFRPGTSLSSGSGAGGSIAIYTKNGIYQKTGNRRYSFHIRGYDGLDAEWK